MDIAALSVGLSQIKFQQQASLAVMKLAMNSAQGQTDLVQELAAVSDDSVAQAAQPDLGQNLDLSV